MTHRADRASKLRLVFVLALVASPPATALAQAERSTRVVDPECHQRKGDRHYPYRAWKDYILKELDLRPGDAVVDVGAGDGWWSEPMAEKVGKDGVVHAAEVDEKLVQKMRERFASAPQVRPYLCKADDTCLAERSCDLAFLSQSFHHLPKDRVNYLHRLRDVVKPTGRLAVIEKYAAADGSNPGHGTNLSMLSHEAEEAGWILVRYELMAGTGHYLAIFVQKDLFPRRLRL
ncbi:MAG: class I SAM-dependent methyltransferase [Planctomycetes bacterium]|nr:class I SAM-dependent methyltransferase [Planctomycetota bacterium]